MRADKIEKEVVDIEVGKLEATRNNFISNLPEAIKSKVEKLQLKIKEFITEREELKSDKQVEETRGRNKKVDYVEFVLGLTDVPTKDNELNILFKSTVMEFIEQEDIFKNLEMTTGSIHLDQAFLHTHVLFKIPDNTTWDKHITKNNSNIDGRSIYKSISKAWLSHCKKKGLEELIGEKFKEHTDGGKREYSKSLHTWRDNQDTKAFEERLKALQEKQLKRVEARKANPIAKLAEEAEKNMKASEALLFGSSKAESKDSAAQSSYTNTNNNTTDRNRKKK